MATLTTSGFRFRLLDLLGPAGADRKATAADARQGLVRRIVVGSILSACVVIGGTTIIVANLRAHMLADSERELRNMAVVLAEQSARSFEALALVESGLVQRI